MEPALVKEHFLTAEDERIRKEDVPERLQVGREGGWERGRGRKGKEVRERENATLDLLTPSLPLSLPPSLPLLLAPKGWWCGLATRDAHP